MKDEMRAARRSDVLVVGGGVIGMAVAHALAGEGRHVVLLERARPGAGASTAAAGMLAPQAESEGPGHMLDFGLASRRLYPSWIDALRRDSGIDPHLESPGTLEAALDREEAGVLERRAAWQRDAGLPARLLGAAEAAALSPGLTGQIVAGLLLPEDGRVDPVRLCAALAEALPRAGVRAQAGMAVEALLRDGDRITGVRAGGREWHAPLTVLAAGFGPALPGAEGLPLPAVEPVRGQMLSLAPERPARGPTLAGAGGYLVPRRSGQVVVGSTTERVGPRPWPTAAGIAGLLRTATRLRPDLSGARMVSAWAGLRPAVPDGLPVIGPAAEGLILALGHYRNGILLAPATARLVCDLAAGRQTAPEAAAFRPRRLAAVARPPAG